MQDSAKEKWPLIKAWLTNKLTDIISKDETMHAQENF